MRIGAFDLDGAALRHFVQRGTLHRHADLLADGREQLQRGMIELAWLPPGHGQAALHHIVSPQGHGGKGPNVQRVPGGCLRAIELAGIRQGLDCSSLNRMIDKACVTELSTLREMPSAGA